MSQAQEIKAKRILDRITCVDIDAWLLPSLSQPYRYHTVILSNDKLECDCRGYLYTQNCYHVIAINMLRENNQQH